MGSEFFQIVTGAIDTEEVSPENYAFACAWVAATDDDARADAILWHYGNHILDMTNEERGCVTLDGVSDTVSQFVCESLLS